MRGDEFMRNEGRKEGRKEGFWMTREKYERKERTRIGLMICAIIFVRNNSLFAVCLESTMERNPFRLHFRLTNNPLSRLRPQTTTHLPFSHTLRHTPQPF